MLSKPLFKREIKANYKILIVVLAVIAMYGSIIIAMFEGELGDSLKMMADSMKPIFAAMGMSEFSDILVVFIAQMLYELIFIIMPLIFIILLANRLMIRYIDRGSMAYILATPNSRGKVAFTQIVVMLVMNIIMVAFTTLLGIAVSEIMFPGELEIGRFIILNIGLLCICLFFSGFCFCAACMFQESKWANGIGIGAPTAFLLIKMLAQTSEKSDGLKYLTPMTLFNAKALVTNEASGYIGAAVLLGLGIIFFIIGYQVFRKKDLSL